MRPEYNGVKYYSQIDWSISHNFERATEILDSRADFSSCSDINEIIELYNINQIISAPNIKSESSSQYIEVAKSLMGIVAKFFSSINDSTVLELYRKVSDDYLDDFWLLFDKFKVYDRISHDTFHLLLAEPDITLSRILKHKDVVKHFDKVIAAFMRQSDQTARIIVDKFLEKKSKELEYSFPKSLKPFEYESILNKYIDSEDVHPGVLQLIANSQSDTDCPISDHLRLKARKKAALYWSIHSSEGLSFSFDLGVCFKSNPEIITLEEVESHRYQIIYDVDWIKGHLDYPTLWNNFIYLFGFVDSHYRCMLVSTISKLGVLERSLGIKGKKEYEYGMSFRIADMKSSLELDGYTQILSEYNIRIEDMIQWFFTDYMKNEFDVNDFVINMPSKGCTTLEKCRILPSEMDGVLKQYAMYVKDHMIDRELLEMSSNHVLFKDLPSMIEKKYAYANSEDIQNEMFLLFSDQSLLHYLPQFESARSFCDLATRNEIKKSDYPEWQKTSLEWLENRGSIFFDGNERIRMNLPRAALLKDLYDHEVICVMHSNNQDLIEQMVSSGDLQYASALFSIPEQSYLNYMLNKAQYSNGLDLRNKYIHSSYHVSEEQYKNDYLLLMKTMIITVLKINEEFCLVNPVHDNLGRYV